MIDRQTYMSQIEKYLGLPLVKVLTGIRRCGKSTVLQLMYQSLKARGIPSDRLFLVNMEALEWDEFRNYQSLYRLVKERLPEGGYFLLDEAQEVAGWERLVASLVAEGLVECVVTGSNASLLTSELGTLLTGRFIEIPVFPLSFEEFLRFQGEGTKATDFLLARYLKYGGFPALGVFGADESSVRSYLMTLLDSIVFRDVIGRHAVRDPEGLKRVLSFVVGNVGNLSSARKISEYLKSQRRILSTDTVANYLHYLTDAFVLYRARRYDIKGKLHLEYTEKYYVADLGLRFGLLGHRPDDIAGLLENVVFLELLRRGYRVSIGVLGSLEVDFVAEKEGSLRYYQVTTELGSEATIEREFASLERIADHWPKAVIVGTPTPVTGRSGIQVLGLMEFLLGRPQ